MMEENLIEAIDWTMNHLKNAPNSNVSGSTIVLEMTKEFKKDGQTQPFWHGKTEAAFRYLKDANMIIETAHQNDNYSLSYLGYEWESYEKFVQSRNENNRIRILQKETSEKQNKLLEKTLSDYDTVQQRAINAETRAKKSESRAKISFWIAIASVILSIIALII